MNNISLRPRQSQRQGNSYDKNKGNNKDKTMKFLFNANHEVSILLQQENFPANRQK